jgi:drug/metabolite transporter (DMT)-like permease
VGADAFALVLGSALLHAWWSVSIKGSGDPLVFNALQVVAPLLAGAAIVPWVDLGEVPPLAWACLAATTLCHTGYFWWMSRAYEHGELTLVYPIARSTPAFLPFVAVPLLGERISVGGAFGIATVVAGMWLVQASAALPSGTAKLRRQAFAEPAVRYALLTLAATVAYSLLDARAMREIAAHPWTSALPRALVWNLLLWSASGALFAALVARRRGARALFEAARRDLASPTRAALVSLAGYTLVLEALASAPASYVVAVRQSSVLFALLFGVLRLRERPGRPRILGALATVAGVALIALSG